MSRLARRLIATAAAAAALLAAAPAAAAACPGSSAWAQAQGTYNLEQSILCLINERRAAAGLRSVTPNDKLRAAGLRHSAEMVRVGYFAHTSPAGVSFIDRIREAGYTRGSRTWQVGENLVWGSAALSSPAELVRAWMESPPHRANLLKPRFREIGIAAVRGTPADRTDSAGITVSSEYGFRAKGKKGKKAKKASRCKKGKGKRGKRQKSKRCQAGKSRRASKRG